MAKEINKIWLNHKLVSELEAKIPIMDRGFLYGDGVYETLRVYDGKIFRADAHFKRLDDSLKGIKLKIPWPHLYLTKACLATIRANQMKEALIRVTVSRGSGDLGYDPASCKKPTLVIFAVPIRSGLPELWKSGIKISIVKTRRNHPVCLNPAIKSTNCLNGIFAKMESLKKGAFEGVFLNFDGYLAEGTISNIFIIKSGILKTPALECGILDGVTRRTLLETAQNSDFQVLQTHIKPFELMEADEAFLTSTTMELMPIVQVDEKKIGSGQPGPVTKFLHAKFLDILRKELKLTGKYDFYHTGR